VLSWKTLECVDDGMVRGPLGEWVSGKITRYGEHAPEWWPHSRKSEGNSWYPFAQQSLCTDDRTELVLYKVRFSAAEATADTDPNGHEVDGPQTRHMFSF
jgi:hypothetical protein